MAYHRPSGSEGAQAACSAQRAGPTVGELLRRGVGAGSNREAAWARIRRRSLAWRPPDATPFILCAMAGALTLTAVFTPDENGWTMAQLAEWPAVVTCGRTVEEARSMLLDAAREMIASYHNEGREPPIGGGHVEPITIDLAA